MTIVSSLSESFRIIWKIQNLFLRQKQITFDGSLNFSSRIDSVEPNVEALRKTTKIILHLQGHFFLYRY